MTTMRTLLAVLFVAPMALSQISCNQLECGEGTTESNGTCVLADGARPENPTYCAPGTVYDDNMGGCVAELPPTVCDENTTVEIVDENGVVVCMGTGTGGGCNLTCPQAASGRVTVCGVLKDVETSAEVGEGGTGALCDLENPTADGACSLEMKFYDALQFAQNPTGTAELPYDDLKLNDCGHFVVQNVPAPALGFLAIGADDSEAGSSDNYVLAGVALPVTGGQRIDDLDTYVVRQATDATWSGAVSLPGGQSFVERGVYVPIFLHKGQPVSGVVVTEGGSPQVAEDYYFSDTDPLSRSTVDPGQNSTGANGSALLVDSELVMHSGTGSEGMLEGCVWPSDLADAIPGVAFVQDRHSEDTGTGEDCE